MFRSKREIAEKEKEIEEQQQRADAIKETISRYNTALKTSKEAYEKWILELDNIKAEKKLAADKEILAHKENNFKQWEQVEHDWHAGSETKRTELAKLDAEISARQMALEKLIKFETGVFEEKNVQIIYLQKLLSQAMDGLVSQGKYDCPQSQESKKEEIAQKNKK